MHYVLLDEDNKMTAVLDNVLERGEVSHYHDGTGWQTVPASRLRLLKAGQDVVFGADISTVETLEPPPYVTDFATLEGAVLELAEMVGGLSGQGGQ